MVHEDAGSWQELAELNRGCEPPRNALRHRRLGHSATASHPGPHSDLAGAQPRPQGTLPTGVNEGAIAERRHCQGGWLVQEPAVDSPRRGSGRAAWDEATPHPSRTVRDEAGAGMPIAQQASNIPRFARVGGWQVSAARHCPRIGFPQRAAMTAARLNSSEQRQGRAARMWAPGISRRPRACSPQIEGSGQPEGPPRSCAQVCGR